MCACNVVTAEDTSTNDGSQSSIESAGPNALMRPSGMLTLDLSHQCCGGRSAADGVTLAIYLRFDLMCVHVHVHVHVCVWLER